jgi:TRAP-type mannitol/chloroaromatic compound transport system permease large subunit
MGYLVERSNILDKLFLSIQKAAHRVPGSLALAALATCALFATATGIVGAVVTLMGLLAFPAMLKAGYDVRLAAGVICAGGTLGILIPPSIMLIVYGAAAGVSVVKLYAAAMLPGFLLAGLYILYVIGRTMLNPSLAPKLPREEQHESALAVTLDLLTSFVPLASSSSPCWVPSSSGSPPRPRLLPLAPSVPSSSPPATARSPGRTCARLFT